MTVSYENVLEELLLCLAGFSGDVFLEAGTDAAGAAAGCVRSSSGTYTCTCMHCACLPKPTVHAHACMHCVNRAGGHEDVSACKLQLAPDVSWVEDPDR